MSATPIDFEEAGSLAQSVAELAVRSIGPAGTVLQTTSEADASLLRASFIARLAEAATAIANGDSL